MFDLPLSESHSVGVAFQTKGLTDGLRRRRRWWVQWAEPNCDLEARGCVPVHTTIHHQGDLYLIDPTAFLCSFPEEGGHLRFNSGMLLNESLHPRHLQNTAHTSHPQALYWPCISRKEVCLCPAVIFATNLHTGITYYASFYRMDSPVIIHCISARGHATTLLCRSTFFSVIYIPT